MKLNLLMKQGVNTIMKTAGSFYLGNKKGRAFLAETLPHIKRSATVRERHEASGTHIPVFLIASVASQCNLHCKGCYARSEGTCNDAGTKQDLSTEEWNSVFAEASDLGVAFTLIAGGEPLMRKDVICAAAKHKNMVFPIFTNGTMIDDEYLSLFDSNRNLIPLLSLEGDRDVTDARRGTGTYERINSAMKRLKQNSILYGVSITVTRENIDAVVSRSFLKDLRAQGCGIAIFVEYVPTEPNTKHLVLTRSDLTSMDQKLHVIRRGSNDMVILSFPGDEEALGGCLASGRGFFHINPKGGAEPCPFSPYAQHNVRETPLKTVLNSEYFRDLQRIAARVGAHTGGCTLFEHEQEVLALQAQF